MQTADTESSVQAGRVVVLLGAEHHKLWDMGDATLKGMLPPEIYERLAPRTAGFRRGHGTVAFFEDKQALKEMGEKNPAVAGMMDQWSEHANGMLQFVGEYLLWCEMVSPAC